MNGKQLSKICLFASLGMGLVGLQFFLFAIFHPQSAFPLPLEIIRGIYRLYGIIDMALLAAAAICIAVYGIRRRTGRERPASATAPSNACTAACLRLSKIGFFVSLGMGVLVIVYFLYPLVLPRISLTVDVSQPLQTGYYVLWLALTAATFVLAIVYGVRRRSDRRRSTSSQ